MPDDDRLPKQGPPEALYRPGHDAGGAVPEREQPLDLRDKIGADAADMRPDGGAVGDPLVDAPPAAAPPYPAQTVVERPYRAEPAGSPRSTADTSLSRAVDRAAAARDPAADGFERLSGEPDVGPLGPSVEQQSPAAEDQPAGQWGSSGEPTP